MVDPEARDRRIREEVFQMDGLRELYHWVWESYKVPICRARCYSAGNTEYI